MSDEPGVAPDPAVTQREPDLHAAVEISVRLGVLLLLVAWVLLILAPFASIVIWAAIIAVASQGLFSRIAAWLGGRRRVAALLLVLLALAFLIVPSVLLSETLVGGSKRLAANVESGDLTLPPPPAKVARVPFVGEQVFEAWQLASENLSAALEPLKPQLRVVSAWLLRAASSVGIALLQLTASIVLAGVFLVRGEAAQAALGRLAVRLSGERGPEFLQLAGATVRSVVQGIVGIAVLQATLAGLGFIVADVPAAGLWALLVLGAAVMQLPVPLVMVGPILLVYSAASPVVAVPFAIWCLAVAVIDNVLKPILFSRGVQVPAIVVFLGAIGGMLAMGLIGLFLGAVVLALGYELLLTWLGEEAAAPEERPAA